jgi:hypothetical protein
VQEKTREVQQRALRFAGAVDSLCVDLFQKPATNPLARRLSAAATAVDRIYRDASAAPSRDAFISRMSQVARSAKRARTILQDLVALNEVSIERARDLILEARAFETIFAVSLRTARRRVRAASRRFETRAY